MPAAADRGGSSETMSSPTEDERADIAPAVAVQLDKVKERVDEVRGDLIDTIDALRAVLDTGQQLTELQSASTQGAQNLLYSASKHISSFSTPPA